MVTKYQVCLILNIADEANYHLELRTSRSQMAGPSLRKTENDDYLLSFPKGNGTILVAIGSNHQVMAIAHGLFGAPLEINDQARGIGVWNRIDNHLWSFQVQPAATIPHNREISGKPYNKD